MSRSPDTIRVIAAHPRCPTILGTSCDGCSCADKQREDDEFTSRSRFEYAAVATRQHRLKKPLRIGDWRPKTHDRAWNERDTSPRERMHMQKLVDGIHEFQKTHFGKERRLFETLVEGQSPLALFVTCSDSRIDPNRLTQTKPGELFIQRTAGNIVPPYGSVQGGEAATIEYAVTALKVRDLIICGHSHCGAMAGLLNPEAVARMPAVRAYLEHAEATRRIVEENYDHLTDPDKRLTLTVEENVLVQLENLRTHPSVAAAVSRGELKLHGWVYKFETGQVFTYDPQQVAYVPLETAAPAAVGQSRMLPAI